VNDSAALVAQLDTATGLLSFGELTTADSDAQVWAAEMMLAEVSDTISRGAFIAGPTYVEDEVRAVALKSLAKAMDLCRVARKQLFMWEKRETAQRISIEVLRAQEVLRRTEFYVLPRMDSDA
jgi:hypothetical protein